MTLSERALARVRGECGVGPSIKSRIEHFGEMGSMPHDKVTAQVSQTRQVGRPDPVVSPAGPPSNSWAVSDAWARQKISPQQRQ